MPNRRYLLRLDDHRFVYLDVDEPETPHVVRSLRREGDRLVGWLADGTEEVIDASSLRMTDAGHASCRVKGGRFGARLSSGAWSALSALVVDEGGEAILGVGDHRVSLGPSA